jgi:hypothetical protein
MKRISGMILTLAAVCGCATTGGPAGQAHTAGSWGASPQQGSSTKVAKTVPNAVGPWGEPAAQTQDANVTQASAKSSAATSMKHFQHVEVVPEPPKPPFGYYQNNVLYAAGAIVPGCAPVPMPTSRSQVRFVGPAGAKIGWYVPAAAPDKDGKPVMTPYKLDIPGRYNFLQASVYRLKLSDIPGRPGVQLYPTIEVVPANPKTDAFLAHNAIPVEFTEEDFDQVTAGNFITKVIYLPDAQHASPIAGGPEELVSTRLEPGVDPIAEAHRRGYILMVVRLGGIELESINSPPLEGSGMFGPPKGPGAGAMMNPPVNPVAMPPAPMSAPPMPASVPSLPAQGAASASDAYRPSR